MTAVAVSPQHPLAALAARYLTVIATPGGVAARLGVAVVVLHLFEERQWPALAIVAGLAGAYGFLRPSVRAVLTFVVGTLAQSGSRRSPGSRSARGPSPTRTSR